MSRVPTPAEVSDLTAWVELYEYKVGDLCAGRTPKGGVRSVRELRRTLLGTDLPAPLLRRLVQADRLYLQQAAEISGAPGARQAALPSPTGASEWQPPATDNEDETRAWHELQLLLWHADLMDAMHARTQELRHEPLLTTLRVLYAVTENAERAGRNITALFSVPAPDDPLVSLDDREVVRQLTSTLGDMLLLPADRQRVWQALERVQAEPFPLLSEKEAAYFSAPYRDPGERPHLRAAAQRLQQWWEPWRARLPQMLQGAAPAQSILYAQEAQSALSAPPQTGELLCLHLGTPQRLAVWQDLKLSWRSLGPNWQLLVQSAARVGEGGEAGKEKQTQDGPPGQLALLRPELPASERHLTLKVGGHRLRVFFSGDYVLLHHEQSEERLRRLARLAALGRGLALLLNPAENYGHLRLARALAQRLRGGPRHTSGTSVQRYAALTPAERLYSARRTLEALGPLLAQAGSSGTEQAISGALHALHLPYDYAPALHQAVHQAAFVPETLRAPSEGHGEGPGLLSPNGVFVQFRLGHEPLELRLPGDRLLSLKRDFRGALVALLPGHPAVTVDDVQVLLLHDLNVVLAVEGSDLAACALPLAPGSDDPEQRPLSWH